MSEFMRAHGYLPGPTQRPVIAGFLTALPAEIATLPVLWLTGALGALTRSTGQPLWFILVIYLLIMTVAGGLYGRIFMRAANDQRGGWLFGISFAFLLWLLGPATLLQCVVKGPLL